MIKKQIKVRHVMYTQRLSHLPFNNMDELVETIETKLKAQKYGVILHDKDIDENKKTIESHVHAMISFKNPRSVGNIAKLLKDKPQYVEAWKGNYKNGYSYLIHQTKEAMDKHQYDPKEVISNFNYIDLIEKIKSEVQIKNQKIDIKLLLDALFDETLTKEEIESRMSGSQIGQYKRQIDNTYTKLLEKKAEVWRKEMITERRKIKVIWIYGEAGVGKTSLAKDYASRMDRPYYITGSTKDPFQNYKGEHCLIFDELRPKALEYQDLLRMFDPFGEQVFAPSRYNDKALVCDTIIITSPFNPYDFYFQKFKYDKKDSFLQLLRRLSLVIEVTIQDISAMKWNYKKNLFIKVRGASEKNRFYRPLKKRETTKEIKKLFKELLE